MHPSSGRRRAKLMAATTASVQATLMGDRRLMIKDSLHDTKAGCGKTKSFSHPTRWSGTSSSIEDNLKLIDSFFCSFAYYYCQGLVFEKHHSSVECSGCCIFLQWPTNNCSSSEKVSEQSNVFSVALFSTTVSNFKGRRTCNTRR